MPKIDYSKFEEPGEAMVPSSDVTILDKPAAKLPEIVETGQAGIGRALETAVNPVVSVINNAIDLIRCIEAVSAEKQMTYRTEAQARVLIEAAKQETERVRIHETGETDRFAMQCKKDLKVKKQELEALREKYRFEEEKISGDHSEFSQIIETLNKLMESFIKDKDEIRKRLQFIEDNESYEKVFCQLNEINGKIIELAKEVAALRKGKA